MSALACTLVLVAALDALMAQAAVSEDFADGGRARRALDELSDGPDVSAAMREEYRAQRLEAQLVPSWMAKAETFYVDPLMAPLVCAAGAAVTDGTLVEEWDPPAEFGFCFIGGRVTELMIVKDTGELSTNAFEGYLWARLGDGVQVCRLGRAAAGFWIPEFTHRVLFNQPLRTTPGNDQVHGPIVVPGRLEPRPENAWTYPVPEGDLRAKVLTETTASGPTTDSGVRWLLACWRLMRQTAADVEAEVPTRQLRRQLERRNVATRQVSVIRRRSNAGTGGTTVNWTHRWLVRGHWHQQRCKDADGNWTTRPVFIHPHIKGLEEAPLLTRAHINHLVQ